MTSESWPNTLKVTTTLDYKYWAKSGATSREQRRININKAKDGVKAMLSDKEHNSKPSTWESVWRLK